MMILDPTYLRTIYDGLNSGALNKDNASALPMGLVGMYDAEIPPVSSVNNRKRFLDFFAVWALLKKEVSLEFILPLLEGWTEVQLLDYMAKYSKWFNSPVPGKFELYHERLRVFLLQKISNNQIKEFNKSICIHKNDENEYLILYKIDHQIILSYFDLEYYKLVKEVVLQIKFKHSDDNENYLAKKRWYKDASILGGYFKDFNFIQKLHINYNEFLRPSLDFDDDWNYFLLSDIYFLIDKAQSFFLDQMEEFIYLSYFLNLILHQKPLNKSENDNITLLIDKLNQISRLLISRDDFVLNKYYLNYLNDILREKELQLLELDASLDGFPILMTEDGFGGMFDYGFDRDNQILYFGGGNLEKIKIENLLVKSFESIEGFPNSSENAKLTFEKLLILLHKGNIKPIESLLKKVRKKLIYSETSMWDDLLVFDHFIFDIFKFVTSINSNYNFNSWRNLFICSPKLWQQNMSFWKMLVDIDLEGDIDIFYRNYNYGSNEISNGDKYIIDELGFISLVLSLYRRNYDIPFLIKKSFNVLLNKSYYNYAIDILSSSFLLGSVKGKNLTLIKKYFYKNEIISSTIYLQQLCELLSDKFNFLDLIDFVYYDYHLQSDVSDNYEWALNIINSIKNKKTPPIFLNYVIDGFDIYIKIMGMYSLDELKNPEDCPSENKWKIEWWVMCNFYASILEVLKNDKKNLKLFEKSIEKIFLSRGFNSQINLKKGLERYLYSRKSRNFKLRYNFEYLLHQNPKNQLLLFKDNMNNKEIISKIAGSIKSGILKI